VLRSFACFKGKIRWKVAMKTTFSAGQWKQKGQTVRKKGCNPLVVETAVFFGRSRRRNTIAGERHASADGCGGWGGGGGGGGCWGGVPQAKGGRQRRLDHLKIAEQRRGNTEEVGSLYEV